MRGGWSPPPGEIERKHPRHAEFVTCNYTIENGFEAVNVGIPSNTAAQVFDMGQVIAANAKAGARRAYTLVHPIPVGGALDIPGINTVGGDHLARNVIIAQVGIFQRIAQHMGNVRPGNRHVTHRPMWGGAMVTDEVM